MSPLKPRSEDPLKNFLFRVEIQGITQAGFTEATGFASTSDQIDYRTGDQQPSFQKIPGLTKFGELVLKWGMTMDAELIEWRQRIIEGAPIADNRKDIFLITVDEQGEERTRIHLKNAWPSNADFPDAMAKGNDVQIMSMTFTHEGTRLV